MNNGKLCGRWQKMFSELITEIGDKYDHHLIYESSRPTFFREEIKRVEGIDSVETGLSRLEWLPDLPPVVEWPQHEGKAMDFVAQINLADVEVDFHPLLPSSGWLFFFVGDFWNHNMIPHRVFYFEGPATELVRTSPPDNLEPPEINGKHTFWTDQFPFGLFARPKISERNRSLDFQSRPGKRTPKESQISALRGVSV